MNRRSFLGLLVAAPMIPAFERIEPVIAAARARPVLPPVTGKLERFVLPFGASAGFNSIIRPGEVARFGAYPQLPFRPDRLFISGRANVLAFHLLNVSSKGEPQLEEAVPAWVFSPEAMLGAALQFDAIGPGDVIELAVRNVSSAHAEFSAVMMGDAVRSFDRGLR